MLSPRATESPSARHSATHLPEKGEGSCLARSTPLFDQEEAKDEELCTSGFEAFQLCLAKLSRLTAGLVDQYVLQR
jgi:hypothetical protein